MEFLVQNQAVFQLVMQEDVTQLEEVVMMGYGSQIRNEVAASITAMRSKEIKKLSVGGVATVDNALGGLVQGLKVLQNSGKPGMPANINIRGYTSPFSTEDTNQPLLVIDGLPIFVQDQIISGGSSNSILDLVNAQSQNPLLLINIQDIERINILRDAAATSIYGSRGANGVIIITTKKGEKTKSQS